MHCESGHFWRMDYGMALYILHTTSRCTKRRLAKPNSLTHVSFLSHENTVARMCTRQRPLQLYECRAVHILVCTMALVR